MTWAEAKKEAEKRAEEMLVIARDKHIPPGSDIGLSLYDETAWTLFADQGPWSHEDHEVIVRAIARILSANKYRPRFKRIVGSDYLDWLVRAARDNGPEARAEYIASLNN